jgi:hypothetical protein
MNERSCSIIISGNMSIKILIPAHSVFAVYVFLKSNEPISTLETSKCQPPQLERTTPRRLGDGKNHFPSQMSLAMPLCFPMARYYAGVGVQIPWQIPRAQREI